MMMMLPAIVVKLLRTIIFAVVNFPRKNICHNSGKLRSLVEEIKSIKFQYFETCLASCY